MMKLLFALFLIANWTTDCEGVPNEDQAEKSHLAKKNISNAEFRHVIAKRQKDKTRENAAERQRHIAEITRNFIVSEIERYFANSRICDMGSFEFLPSFTESGKDIHEFEIQYEKAFPRIPKVTTALKTYEKSSNPAQVVKTFVNDVTRTSARFTFYTFRAEVTRLEATWIACL